MSGTTVSHAATITFQTEQGKPKIVSTTPTNHALSVLTNTQIHVTFSDDMDTSTLNTTTIKLIDLSTGQLVPSWASAVVSTTTTSFDITQNLNLESQKSYALVLTTGVKGFSGSTLDPTDSLHRNGTIFGEAWVVEFATGNSLSSTAVNQTIIGNIVGGPTGGQTNVPINATIKVQFERAMDSSSMNSTSVQLKKTGTATALTVNLSYDDVANTLTITPQSVLEYSTSYTLTLTGLTDVTGNTLP
jgi:hypothetical protein